MFGAGRKREPLLALALVSSVSIPASAAQPLPLVHTGLSEPVRAWQKAMEAGDIAALARMHGPHTIGFPPDKMMMKGAGAIMADYTALFARYSARVAFEEAGWMEEPPLTVSWGLYTLTLHPKGGGSDIVTHGRFTDAAVRIGDGWRYIVDHASLPTGK